MFRLLSLALFQSIVVILASHAMASCRQDPREVRLGEAVAKFKTYNCDRRDQSRILPILKSSRCNTCLRKDNRIDIKDNRETRIYKE